MIIGIPREIKTEEYRVGMTPWGVKELVRDGHRVLVEHSAGEGSGFSDEEYLRSGAQLVDKETLFSESELIVKVKEPLPSEYDLLREGQIIFTYLHLAADRSLTATLLERGVVGLGYETLQKRGTLPLLAPMSEIAGRMAPLVATFFLQRHQGGEGVLPTGVAGVRPAKAVVLGAGVVGTNAVRVASGLGMETVVLNRSVEKLRVIDQIYRGRVKTVTMNTSTIAEEIKDADILIGAVLVPGGRTPVLVTRDMLKTMKKGSVIVDVSVDQGGCVQTTRPTTHSDPVYVVDGVIHYAVANMPGAYPRTSTLALTKETLPYIKLIAGLGIERAIKESSEIRSSLNIYRSEIVNENVKKAFEGGA